MVESRKTGLSVLDEVLEIGRQAKASALAIACYDYASDVHLSYQAERCFHAASTIKLAILLGLFRAVEAGRMRLTDRLHVRNRFRSQGDGQPFFLQADRDGDPELYRLVGRTASLQALAETMIVRSSNLATNLLLDFIGVGFVAETLAASGLDALKCLRGVEDEAAFAKGLNNQVTAAGLLTLFRGLQEARIVSPEHREHIFEILFQQRYNGMIPAGLPDGAKARVAHKTGEISTICHDAGMIFLPGRAPYVLIVLSEYPGPGPTGARHKAVAAISTAIHTFFSTLPAPPPNA